MPIIDPAVAATAESSVAQRQTRVYSAPGIRVSQALLPALPQTLCLDVLGMSLSHSTAGGAGSCCVVALGLELFCIWHCLPCLFLSEVF